MTRARPAGVDEVTAYRTRKQEGNESGIDLFRAYVARRNADQSISRERAARLIAQLESESGLSPEAHDAAYAELIMLHILEELDPIMAELVSFCDLPPGKDDQLAALRSALRLGKGRTPADAKRTWQRWRAIPLWIEAYDAMQKTCTNRSDRDIAREIGRKLGVDWRTALRHWEEFGRRATWQAAWVSHIRQQIELSQHRSKG